MSKVSEPIRQSAQDTVLPNRVTRSEDREGFRRVETSSSFIDMAALRESGCSVSRREATRLRSADEVNSMRHGAVRLEQVWTAEQWCAKEHHRTIEA